MVNLAQGEDNLDQDFGYEAPANPDIDIEKFTNGVNADTADLAPEIAPGDVVTWTYEVTNTGDVPFNQSDVSVTDDQEGSVNTIIDQGNDDGILAPGETWIYEQTGTAQNLVTSTGPSQDITFSLTGNSYTTGHAGNVRTFTQGGVSAEVSAFSSNKYGGDWQKAYLGAYGGGLGVTNHNEYGYHHQVDNGHRNDYILFEFDQDVVVDRAFLAYVSNDSDISVWIGDRDGDISLLNNNILNSFTQETNNGGNYSRWADVNVDELTGNTLVIAARTDHNYDAFKLKHLDISVPGETTIGTYRNVGTVTAGSVSDQDSSHYTNPEGADGYDPITGEPMQERWLTSYISSRDYYNYYSRVDDDHYAYVNILDNQGNELFSGDVVYDWYSSQSFDAPDQGTVQIFNDRGGRLLDSFTFDLSSGGPVYESGSHAYLAIGTV